MAELRMDTAWSSPGFHAPVPARSSATMRLGSEMSGRIFHLGVQGCSLAPCMKVPPIVPSLQSCATQAQVVPTGLAHAELANCLLKDQAVLPRAWGGGDGLDYGYL